MKNYKFTYTVRDRYDPQPWSPILRIVIAAPTENGARKHLLMNHQHDEIVIYSCVETDEEAHEESAFW